MPNFTTIMAATALAGGVASAVGQVKQGREIQQAQNFNASIAEQEAGLTRQNAILMEYKARKSLDQTVGTMTAGYAKSGVSVSTGSPLNTIADSISNAELDISLNNYNAEVEARNKENQAKQMRYYGQEAVKSGTYRAIGTLLTSGIDSGYKLWNENPLKLKGEK